MFRKLANNELCRLSPQEFTVSKKNPLIIVLDNVRSQHNIGSAFRSADAFAAEKVILCGICATPPSPEIRKSALGAEESVPWEYYKDTKVAVKVLKDLGYTIVAVEQTENSTMLNHFEIKPQTPTAIVFGNEVKGVSQEVVDECSYVIEIPQFGTKHSINVSVSVGIVLWHLTAKLNNMI